MKERDGGKEASLSTCMALRKKKNRSCYAFRRVHHSFLPIGHRRLVGASRAMRHITEFIIGARCNFPDFGRETASMRTVTRKDDKNKISTIFKNGNIRGRSSTGYDHSSHADGVRHWGASRLRILGRDLHAKGLPRTEQSSFHRISLLRTERLPTRSGDSIRFPDRQAIHQQLRLVFFPRGNFKSLVSRDSAD